MSPSHGLNNPTSKTKTGIWISPLQYPVLVKRWVNVGYGYHANEQPHAQICFSKRCLYTHSLSYVWVYVSGTKFLMRARRAWCLKYFSHMDNDNGMLLVIDTHSSGGMFFFIFRRFNVCYMFYSYHCRVKIGDIFLGLISQHRIYHFIDIRVVVLHCTRGYRAMTAIFSWLTHWGRVTHICVGNLTIIGSDYGLSPGRRQAIIWTNAGILLIRTLGTNFGEILGEIHQFSYSKMHLKMSSAKWRLFCLGLNELIACEAFVRLIVTLQWILMTTTPVSLAALTPELISNHMPS